jgi:protein phosphatase 2C family protein 2/3
MSYAVNTHQGISRNYNEDRVSITLNIKKQGSRAHFFAIYDGHGGHLCCDFLKEELHQRLINNSYFPSEPKKALAQTISQVENLFLEKAM